MPVPATPIHGLLSVLLASAMLAPAMTAETDRLVYPGGTGPGAGKHIVLISGDEEYRSEEAMPMLARILSVRHGFRCTVLFAIGPDGTIVPTVSNMPGAEALGTADAIVMLIRFRNWDDATMKHFVDAYLAGKPIIALRTSTHAFNKDKKYGWQSKEWPGGFGKQVLGETWVAHHGAHKKEATRGIIEAANKDDPILRGVEDIFCTSDVYTANPPADAKILVRGQVVTGFNPTDPPVTGKKNDPMQPVAWTRLHTNEKGTTNKVLCTTMGAASDLPNEGLRRLVINGVFWAVGIDVPAKADVTCVGDYRPTMYGFGTFQKGMRPADFAITGEPGPIPPGSTGKPSEKTTGK